MSHPFEEDQLPVTSNSTTLVDHRGNVFIDGEDDPEEAIEDDEEQGVKVGPSLQSLFTSGVYNGDFLAGPPDESATIEDQNRLPDWRLTVVQGGSITARWVTDAASPSGKAVEWTVTAAAQDDEAYLWQIVPVTPRRRVLAPEYTLGDASPTTGDVVSTYDIQALTVDGTATGAAVTSAAYSWNTAGATDQAVVGLPSDARFLRLRLGVKATAAHSGTTVRNLREVWAGPPDVAYATLTGADVSLPATGNRSIYLVSSNTAGTAADAASRYLAPAAGWVVSVSAIVHAAVTGADIVFEARNETKANSPGDAATIANGNDAGYATSVYDATSNSFSAGDVLRMRSRVPSGTVTSTGRDVVVVMTLALLAYRATTG